MSVPQGQPVQPQGIALQQRQPQFQGQPQQQFQGQPQQQFQGQPQQVYQAQPTGAQPPGQVEAKTSTGQVFYQEPTLRAEPAAPPSHQRMQDKPWTDPEFSVPEYACICTMCLLSIPCYFCNVQTIQTYERGVVLRLGKQMHQGTLNGGMHLVLPTVDELLK